MTSILRIDASARRRGSYTRQLADELIDSIRSDGDTVIVRDLLDGLPLLTEAATHQLAAPADERTTDAARVLEAADGVIDELLSADVLVFSVPIYNFGVPAALKAWADLVARAGTTFAYTDQGPQGLLADKKVYIVAGSGGVPIESDLDFGVRWLRFFLGFLGLDDVQVIKAEGLTSNPEPGLARARSHIGELAAV